MLYLIGTGPLAQEYSKVIVALGVDFAVVGRSQNSSQKFFESTGIRPISGGVESLEGSMFMNSTVINAVGVMDLAKVSKFVLENGCRSLLIEKPGASNQKELEDLNALVLLNKCRTWIAYNRRFYSSVQRAREILEGDGGAHTVHFEFNEDSTEISSLLHNNDIKKNWIIANSSHVLDLAFFLCGNPWEFNNWNMGSLKWHPTGSRFVGAGITDQGALFSYSSNWTSPGRWKIEISTSKSRLMFQPLEKVKLVNMDGSISELNDYDDAIDLRFKPGLYKQVENFIRGDDTHACLIQEQLTNWNLYQRIAGYE